MACWRSPWLRLWLVCLGLLGPAGGRTVADQLEREVGRSVREALRLQYGFLEDRLLTAWIDRVGQPIARLVPRQDYPYVFYVIDTDAVNALAAPGCFIFVTKGLLDTVRNDDELAGVLAHELGHESERHAWRLIGHELPWIAGGQLLAGHLGDLLSLGFSVAHLLDSLGYSRHLENRADRFGLEYSWRAGYDPEGILSFFETIQPKKKPSKLASYFRTHPPTHERM
ncbi:MAG: M48 family metalloprotease, partial [Armatimonadetes bacterium]|nr:M48 family metalloprotease [Armatimonadota bacterium]